MDGVGYVSGWSTVLEPWSTRGEATYWCVSLVMSEAMCCLVTVISLEKRTPFVHSHTVGISNGMPDTSMNVVMLLFQFASYFR
jgi:hypothetical protein